MGRKGKEWERVDGFFFPCPVFFGGGDAGKEGIGAWGFLGGFFIILFLLFFHYHDMMNFVR